MEKIEIYKNVKDHYNVVLHHDNSEISTREFIENRNRDKAGRVWVQKESYLNSQEKFVEHFADKLAAVNYTRNTAVIEKTGDKVSLKFFHNEKHRGVGNHWFAKNRYMLFLTINTKTGVLYSGSIHGLHNKKRKKKINTNNFWGSFLDIFDSVAFQMKDAQNSNSRRNLLNTIVKLFFEQIPDWRHPINDGEELTLTQLQGPLFYRYYLTKKQVKLPDNFNMFYGYKFYVPTKYFKKANNKYIDALLLYNGLSGDKFRKAFHEVGGYHPTLQTLKYVVDLVGKTRVEQNYEILKKYLKYKNDVYPLGDTTFLTESERKNIWLILTQTPYDLLTIRDHVKFLGFLRDRGMNFKWKAKTEFEFRREHKLLTDTYDAILHGVTHRIYPQEYHDWFKDPVEVGVEKYKVQILDKQGEFYQESDYQQNCVKTYISRPGSFILSIRSGKDRATIEYSISSSKTLWHIDRVQSLGRFNKVLPQKWDSVLDVIDKMVVEMIGKYGYQMTLHKEKAGKENTWELSFDINGRPIWDTPLELQQDIDYLFF